MHTKDILATALREAGLHAMADKAAEGYYHDFLSPLDTPSLQLAEDLDTYANAPGWPRRDAAAALLERHLNGAFDASEAESQAWAASTEGQEVFGRLADGVAPQPQIGRLAVREEGVFWKAYYAEADKMEGALLIGSIRLAMVQTEARKQAFLELMRDAVSDVVEAAVGSRPEWAEKPHAAPEHERTKH